MTGAECADENLVAVQEREQTTLAAWEEDEQTEGTQRKKPDKQGWTAGWPSGCHPRPWRPPVRPPPPARPPPLPLLPAAPPRPAAPPLPRPAAAAPLDLPPRPAVAPLPRPPAAGGPRPCLPPPPLPYGCPPPRPPPPAAPGGGPARRVGPTISSSRLKSWLQMTQQVMTGGKPGGSRPWRKRKSSCRTWPCVQARQGWSAGRAGRRAQGQGVGVDGTAGE